MAYILFYDGTCGFCHGVVQFLCKIDKKGVLYYAPLYGETFAEKAVPQGEDESIILYHDREKTRNKSDAALHTLVLLGGGWKYLAKVLGLFPGFLRDMVYDFVAKVRYALGGRRTKDACPMMPVEYHDRMLP